MENSENFHKHKCAFCGFVWQHHDCNDVRHGDYGAHECPGCHRCNWGLGIYDGPEEPRVTNGKVPAAGVNAPAPSIHNDQNHITPVKLP